MNENEAKYEKLTVQLASWTVQCAADDERLTDEQRADIYNAVHNELYCHAALNCVKLLAEAYTNWPERHLFPFVLDSVLQMALEKHEAAFNKADTLVQLLRNEDEDKSSTPKPTPWSAERGEQSNG